MNVNVATALDGLNTKLGDYIFLSKKLPSEALAKKGTDLGFELEDRLKKLKPAKGSIRTSRLAALKSGRGIRVRPQLIRSLQDKLGLASRLSDRNRKKPQAVYGKGLRTMFRRKGQRLNFRQMAVKAELSARESGVGYSAFVGRAKGIKALESSTAGAKTVFSRGRYNQLLSSANLSVESDGSSLLIVYGSSENQAGSAIAKQDAAVADALDAVATDIGVYIARKLQEAGR
jgi:hypothetical protein